MKEKLPESLWMRFVSKSISYTLFILCVILSVSLINNIKRVKDAQKLISDKEKEVQEAKNEQVELQKQLEYAKSQEFIEAQMRDQLGLAKEGEVVIILPPADVVRKFAPKREEVVPVLSDPNWKKWVKLFI